MSKGVAVITGSTSGIGWNLAQNFAKAGYDVALSGISDEGKHLAKEIAENYSVRSMYSSANLSTAGGCRKLIEETNQELKKPISVLINNAGIQFVSPIHDFPEEKWNDILSINLSAAFFLTQAVWKQMVSQNFGRVINIASAHGMVASEFKSAYVASKHGLIGLTKVTALEGAPHRITCNAICPGYIKTAMVEGQVKDQAKAHGISEEEVAHKIFLAKHAVKEFVPMDLVSKTALWFADETADTLTGVSIPLDAGWTAQ